MTTLLALKAICQNNEQICSN